ncbi:hypothetical protein AMECASPLE_024153, partial [Ameca splendens]
QKVDESLTVSTPPKPSSKKSGTGVLSQMKKKFSVFMKPRVKSSKTDAANRSHCEYTELETQGNDSRHVEKKKPHKDPLLQLVSLQRASGSWLLDADLAAVLGKTREEVEKAKPGQAKQEVWTTILALIWLHGFKKDQKEEWELLSLKAVLWLNDQNASFVPECIAAGNALLACSVEREALGI